jgi:hypothetical protein
MSESSYEHPIKHHDPSEGFDRTDPSAKWIWIFAVGSVITLVVTIFALQQYFEGAWNQAVYEKVQLAPNQDINFVRGRDDWDLTHYEYLDQKTGQIRIPLDRAQELFMKEIAAGKPFYPGKPTVPKPEEPDTTAAQPGAAAAQPGAAPAPADQGKK